jgi:hypothetical protein
MRQDADLNQRIAGRTIARRRAAFASQTQDLAIPRARRNVDVQRGAVGKNNGLLAAIDGIKKGKVEVIADILAPPAASRATLAAEDLGKNVFAPGEIAEICKA